MSDKIDLSDLTTLEQRINELQEQIAATKEIRQGMVKLGRDTKLVDANLRVAQAMLDALRVEQGQA